MVEYLQQLTLEDYIGPYDVRDVIVLMDSGYDNKKIQRAVADKQWQFIMALGKTRSGKSQRLYLTTPKSQQWGHIATFFRHHRWLKWQTIRIPTNGTKRQRMEFRGIRIIRDSEVSVRYSERVNSSKSSISLQRTDRYGIVGQERCHLQLDL